MTEQTSAQPTTSIGVSRRGLVRAGAIALAGVPAAGISGRLTMTSAPLETLSYAEWSQRNGMLMLALGEAGPIPVTVASVTPMAAPGTRPASLPRASAFEVMFRSSLAAAPSGNATYELWMGSMRSSLFLIRRADRDGEAYFSAIFN